MKQVEPDKGGYHGNYAHDGTDTSITRTTAAREAGHGARDGKREAGAVLPLNRTEAAREAALFIHCRIGSSEKLEPNDGTDTKLNRTEAAREAGLSERQKVTAPSEGAESCTSRLSQGRQVRRLNYRTAPSRN